MIMIQRNKHLWGWLASIQFAFVQLGDSMVRLLSLGLLNTNWVLKFVQYQGTKAIKERGAQK